MIITRIAPSPTGYLHLGTARTALFNYLFAKKHGGRFLLRIEDTDQKRSADKYKKDIIKGLKWLGLNWNGEIICQSQRLSIYQKYIDRLLENGNAYRADGAIWLKVDSVKNLPDRVEFSDEIRGKISFPASKIEDFVIVATGGLPLFLLTNVIDDFEMKITHVIRGEDHISNTPRQILIQKALGLPAPRYAHLPLILAPDKSKMSKRTGAAAVLDYQKMGILPDALTNFLGLLGFHPAGETEIFSLDELAREFDLKRVQKAGAIFNLEKLLDINGYYIRNAQPNKLAAAVKKYTKLKISPEKINRFTTITKDRLRRLSDFDRLADFLVSLPDYQAELLIFKKSTRADTKTALNEVYARLSQAKPVIWENEPKIKKVLETIVAEKDLSSGDVFWSARVALSGLPASPQPSEIAWALGKIESLARIKKALGKLAKR